jgi:hypothetical protein
LNSSQKKRRHIQTSRATLSLCVLPFMSETGPWRSAWDFFLIFFVYFHLSLVSCLIQVVSAAWPSKNRASRPTPPSGPTFLSHSTLQPINLTGGRNNLSLIDVTSHHSFMVLRLGFGELVRCLPCVLNYASSRHYIRRAPFNIIPGLSNGQMLTG